MVTWHQLAVIAGIIIGLGITGFSVLWVFAAGMSDAPQEGPGCAWPLAGLVVLALAIAGIWL